MRSFWAILRDSYREAVSGWVVQVMLVLSLILFLLIGSVSYSPAPVDSALDSIVKKTTTVVPNRGNSLQTQMFFFDPKVHDVESTAPADRPFDGEYAFTLAIESKAVLGNVGVDMGEKEKDAKVVQGKSIVADAFKSAVEAWVREKKDDKVTYTEDLAKEFLTYQLRVNGNLDVKSIESLKPEDGHARYKITAKGNGSKLAWPHKIGVFFGALNIPSPVGLGATLYLIESTLVVGLGGWVLLLVAVVVTAFFLPNMLRKGSIDLLVVKPINRITLLIYKYIGGLIFVLLLTTVTVGGVWAIIGLRSGVWDPGILVTIPAITFYFAILYAISALCAVLTRSAIACIIVTIGFWFLLYVLGTAHQIIEGLNSTPEMDVPKWLVTTADAINAGSPRTKDLDNLISRQISQGLLSESELRFNRAHLIKFPAWGEVIGVSAVYIFVFLALACWRFVTRDG
jgi:ABC-type transport system involved in multi-copper enzyme maturation permease subunit